MTSQRNQALAAALVHDLGHGPFSHSFEPLGKALGLKMAEHEHVSDEIIRCGEVAHILKEMGSGFADDVADIVLGVGEKTVYHAVVSSQFDADRLDYMRRDRLMTGTQHAGIDFAWLLANLEIAEIAYGVDKSSVGKVATFVLGPKAIYAAEAFVLGLFQLYPTVYLHKATRGAEKLFAELLSRLVTIVQDGSANNSGLSDNHPLVRFANAPNDLGSVLALDDTVVWGALPMMADAADKTICQFAKRLRDRKLYKSIDVRMKIVRCLDPEGTSIDEEQIDQVCVRIKEKITEWSSQNGGEVPRVLIDEAERSPYKSVEETKGPLDRINIRNVGGDLVDLKKQSRVVAALKLFKLFRVYVSDNDVAARDAVEQFVKEEIGA